MHGKNIDSISSAAKTVLAHMVKPENKPIPFKECLEEYYPRNSAGAIDIQNSLMNGDIAGWDMEIIGRQKRGPAIAKTLGKLADGDISLSSMDKTNLREGYRLISRECLIQQNTLNYGHTLASGKRELDATGRIIKDAERESADGIVHDCRAQLIEWGGLKKEYSHLLLLMSIRPPVVEMTRS